jgi:hypothetical protein
MANTLTEVIPQILAQGLMALRGSSDMPQLVNRNYGNDAKAKGETVDVPIPSAVAAQAVVPAATPQSTPNVVPTSVALTLDQWYEAPFHITDRERAAAMEGIIPMQASEAIKAIARQVNAHIFSKFYLVGGFAGTPGTTPFATTTGDATDARKVMNIQLAPMEDRRFVLDPDAEANALNLRAFQDYAWSGSLDAIRDGKISQKLGFNWFMDQQVPNHTRGTANGAYTTTAAGFAVGTTTIPVITGAGTFTAGDTVTFAGDTMHYSVKTALAAPGDLVISPGLYQAIPAAVTAVTPKGTSGTAYPQSLAFHRDCFAFASRPLIDETDGLGNIITSAVDPISGLALRLEVSREHKRTRWSFDLLWGSQCVRPQLGCRLWG